jgi:hypothetical protein
MAIHRKRIVFFIFVLCFGLGCCLGSPVNADDPDNILFLLFLPGVRLEPRLGHGVSGIVSLVNGKALEKVEIYENATLRTVTDRHGNYEFYRSSLTNITVTPKIPGYQFEPPFHAIPGNYFFDIPNRDFTAYKHKISGTVLSENKGIGNVEIYGDKKLLAVTNIDGYYETEEYAGIDFTLTPQLLGYEFKPPNMTIVGREYLHENKDFTATKLALVTISGNVTWKNDSSDTNIWSNPLSMVAVEAYAEDGSLSSRGVTGVDGTYSLSVPRGWTGWV